MSMSRLCPQMAKPATNNGAANNTASTTLTITLPDGLSADNRTRLCWQTAGVGQIQARQYGIDALHADGIDWNPQSRHMDRHRNCRGRHHRFTLCVM